MGEDYLEGRQEVGSDDSIMKKNQNLIAAFSKILGIAHVNMGDDDLIGHSAMSMSMPTELPDPKRTNSLTAKEMNRLDFAGRNRVYEDIHGVSTIITEEPDFVDRCLAELEFDIEKLLLQPSNGNAYRLSLTMNPDYVTNRKFRLMFLRCESFVAKRAAARLMLFLDCKLEWFGPEKLTRDIFLSDLDDDDMACLNSGGLQVLPARDRSGRLVFWDTPNHLEYKNLINAARAMFYLTMAALDDEESQKVGCIGVSAGSPFVDEKLCKLIWLKTKMANALPNRLVAVHFCVSNKFMKSLSALAMLGLGSDVRSRSRVHEGTEYEVLYSLMSFGIPVQVAPVVQDWAPKLRNHNLWIERRRAKETCRNPLLYEHKYLLPARNDILLGKGKPFQNHTGNIRFQHLVDSYSERYRQASRKGKKVIIEDIVKEIQGLPARFLQRDADGWWFEASDEMAQKKVAARCRLPPRPEAGMADSSDHPLDAKFGQSAFDCKPCMRAEGQEITKRQRLYS